MDESALRLRIPAGLRLFLAARHRGREVPVTADGTSSLGHLVESVGVPLPEVGALVVDGRPVEPGYRPHGGEVVEVRPVSRPQEPVPDPLRFVLDVHLGTLARRLRLVGVDAAYRNDMDDDALIEQANTERRVLLTQDRGLLRRRALRRGAYVRGARPDAQLADVLGRFAPRLAPWTRCMACNAAPLSPVDKAAVAPLLRPGTRRTYDRFMRCPDCGKVYWRGAHSGRLEGIVRAARRLTALALVSVVLVAGLAGCTDSGSEEEPSPTRSQEVSPFTGLPARPAPVLAVKVDNVPPARPHTGLGAADLVYVEQVEGGSTRLVAVLSSRLPSALGPVRSARESDIELLEQFGRPALAYSGAQSALRPLLEKSPVLAVPPGKAPDAYFRGGDRPAPHNLYVRPARALAAAPGASRAADIGFRFGAAPEGGRQVTEETVRYPAGRYGFTWSAEAGRWLVSMDGTPARTTDGGRDGAATVVVQRITIRDSTLKDKLGSVSPYSETVGSGTALVLRDGKAYDARWSRSDAESGTDFTTPSGDPLNFARGPVWVLLTGG
ncbi:Mut7-C RNAse domain-containing protein [Streptomyces sp. NPDC002055]|uniref:Mut7-C RNAse domain-containing protein n=1 Tax=Streptomyces sp. NPDC002055 TaxID=3154534 RepID=UPI0033195122